MAADWPPAPGAILCPWQAEPYKLWSLLDMLRLYASSLITVFSQLSRAAIYVAAPAEDGDDEVSIVHLETALGECAKELAEIPLSVILRGQFDRLVKRVAAREDSRAVLFALTVELHNNLIAELASHLFLFVPSEKKVLFLDPKKWYGQATADRFPQTERDFRDACQCYALGQWTAAVFHAMRVLERGLHAMATDLGVQFQAGIDLENWKNV